MILKQRKSSSGRERGQEVRETPLEGVPRAGGQHPGRAGAEPFQGPEASTPGLKSQGGVWISVT